ncbi:hypothetical protein ACFVYR_31745 [Streptomyces sp. NPDC058284]
MRTHVASDITDWGIPDAARTDRQLIVSKLAANSVLHALGKTR